MDNAALYKELESVSASRNSRKAVARYFIGNDKNLKQLISLVFKIDDPVSVRAGWVLDMVAEEDITLMLPFLDYFAAGVGTVENESAIRPLARISEKILTSIFSASMAGSNCLLDDQQHEQLLTAAFKWLIGPHKTATKAYAMRCLYYLGKKDPWVHEELRAILKQHYTGESSGYKARARDTLRKLEAFARNAKR